MADNVTVVFLHGAGTGPWIWQRVRAAIPVASEAIAVPSRQENASPEACAAAIDAELNDKGIDRVFVVMHSLAGILAPELGKRLGDRLAGTVFLSAVVPPPGKRFVDVMGFPNGFVLRMLFKFNPRGLKPSSKMLRSELCNDLAEEDTVTLIDRYEAEWPGLYLAPVGAATYSHRPTYIKLLDDRSVRPRLQDRMIQGLPDPHVVTLDAGHMAMLSRPDDLGKHVMQVIEST